jgi:hypothetical protein
MLWCSADTDTDGRRAIYGHTDTSIDCYAN